MLNQLTELARNKNRKSRGELVLALADLFLAAERSEAGTASGLFNEIMQQIVGHADVEARRGVADKLAGCDLMPHDLALSLAEDVIEVAEPLLKQSDALTVADLIKLASTTTIGHQLAIAVRSPLDIAVTDILVQRGNIDVAHTVTKNADACFSKESMGLLVARARKDEVLQGNLAARTDLPPDIVRNLMPFLSKEQKEQLDPNATNVAPDATVEVVGGIRCVEEGRAATVATLKRIRTGNENVDKVVEHLTAQENISEVVFLLAELTQVDEKNVDKSLLLKEAMPIMMICRAAGLSHTGFAAIAQYRCFQLDHTMAAAQAAIRQFRTIPREQAEKTVRSIK